MRKTICPSETPQRLSLRDLQDFARDCSSGRVKSQPSRQGNRCGSCGRVRANNRPGRHESKRKHDLRDPVLDCIPPQDLVSVRAAEAAPERFSLARLRSSARRFPELA